MFSCLKKSLIGLGLGAGLLLVGCQSDNARMAPASHAMAGDAVRCETCKTTFVRKATMNSAGGGRSTGVVTYTTEKKMVCPDCKSAVANFFATGKLQHECKACGTNLEICEAHGM